MGSQGLRLQLGAQHVGMYLANMGPWGQFTGIHKIEKLKAIFIKRPFGDRQASIWGKLVNIAKHLLE